MGKLKSALGAHQQASARAAAQKARESAKGAKVIRSVGEKRALKRQRKEKEAAEAARVAAGRKNKSATDDMEENDIAASASILAAKSRATIPLALDDTILLLGEANFSFAVSLLSRGHPGHLICATGFDSEEECVDKYPDAESNIDALRKAGARVLFNVDGGAVDKHKEVFNKKEGGRWSRVVFNFPHVGKGITDQDRNVRANQEMLLRTLRAVSPLLTSGPSAFPIVEVKKGKKVTKVTKVAKVSKPKRQDTPDSDAEPDEEEEFAIPVPASFTPPHREGSIIITLLDQSPYTLWDLKALATRPPPICPGTKLDMPRYRLLRSFEFVPAAYPGYAHRRTIGWREGKSFANNEEIVGRKGKARSYEFALREDDD